MKKYIRVFIIHFIMAACVFIPFLIKDGGKMLIACDYITQQIPFNMLCNRAIRAGETLWNWRIDLGSDFLTSFSFYTLGSPFFWLYMLFPPEAFPYVSGWLFMLKFATAGLCSYLFLERHTSARGALIGSMLYAFSGYQAAVTVFFHFHDVVAFFPLLMLGMDKLLEEGKRGYFLFAVALNAFVNYYFFVGEVIFCILYYVIRFLIFGEVRPMERLRGIFRCYIEGVLGVMCAAVLFLPSIVSILDNPKSGNTLPVKEFISRNLAAYLLLLRSPFLPGENMFALSAIQESDWTSNSLYLPVVGSCLVIAYILRRFRDRKQDWLSVLLVVCAIIAVFPVLNNMFVLFTREVMRRWFYMPILFMALATARVLEEPAAYPWKKGILISLAMIALSQVYLIWNPDKIYFYKVYILILAGGIGGALFTGLCMRYYDRSAVRRGFTVAVCFACITLTLFTVRNYRRYYRRAWDEKHPKSLEYIYNDLMYSTPNLGDSLPYRYFYWEFEMNRGMAAYEPTRNSFLSTPSPSIIQFYNRMGVGRPKNISPNGPDGLNELFSVRYYVRPDYWNDDVLVEYSNGNMSLRVYENEDALPIGFTYDNYISLKEFRKIKSLNRGLAALKSLVVDDRDVKKVSDILRPYDEALDGKPVAEHRNADMDRRRATSSRNFRYGTDFFACEMIADKPLYAYFSVPYEDGWHAFVNGTEVEILKTNGMMAVRISPGYNLINFSYQPVRRWLGVWISIAGIVLSVLYVGLCRRIVQERNNVV